MLKRDFVRTMKRAADAACTLLDDYRAAIVGRHVSAVARDMRVNLDIALADALDDVLQPRHLERGATMERAVVLDVLRIAYRNVANEQQRIMHAKDQARITRLRQGGAR